MPSLSVDGVVEPVLHVSQLAAALGVPSRPMLSSTHLARDTLVVLDAWLTGIRPLAVEVLLEATPARGRSLRNLTVNVFHLRQLDTVLDTHLLPELVELVLPGDVF